MILEVLEGTAQTDIEANVLLGSKAGRYGKSGEVTNHLSWRGRWPANKAVTQPPDRHQQSIWRPGELPPLDL